MNNQGKKLGTVSIGMIPVSILGIFAFSLIFISAPAGIISGVLACRKGNKALGMVGAGLNAILLVGLVVFMIVAANSSGN